MIVFIIIIVLSSILWTTYRYGISPAPTSFKVKRALLSVLPTIDSGSIYELGAGWGTLAFALADHYPSLPVIAIEVSPIPWAWMHVRQFLYPRKNLTLFYGDFFKWNLLKARLIVCYLYPGAMQKLETKWKEECRETTLITHTFALPHQKANQTIIVRDLYNTPIYIYEK